jgi:acetyltransferase-like isoleucine patch superfamily enzyme
MALTALHWLLTPCYLWRVNRRGRGCSATGPLIRRGRGTIRFGDHVQVRSRWTRAVEISPELTEASVVVGNDVLINQGVTIGARQLVEIGNRVLIADDCKIYDTDFHEIEEGAGCKVAPVRIGDGAWLGANSIVLKGVTIGEDAVIGAGSVVVHDIPPRVLAAGNPAKVIRPINRLASRGERSNLSRQ